MIPNLVTHEWRYMEQQLREVATVCLPVCLHAAITGTLSLQHKDIDMDNDWKLLTLFIGANDLCLGWVCDTMDCVHNYQI